MRRASFKIAKSIKEFGYSQDYSELFYDKDGGIVYPQFMVEDDVPEELIAIPYAMEIWLWLWREKKIRILLNNGAVVSIQDTDLIHHIIYQNNYSDPEDSIIAAIEYLVDNNLIK